MTKISSSHLKKLIFCIITLVFASKLTVAQDPAFSQFYANPLYLNPAFAGSAVCPRIIMNYRDQWPSISGTFVTYNASYDQHIDKLSGGIGILVNADRAGEGTISTSSFSGIYSYRLEVSRTFSIKAALQATYVDRRIAWEKLTFGDQIDPKYGFVNQTRQPEPGNTSKNYMDFSTGIIGYTETFYAGVAISHLTQPEEGIITIHKLPMKFTAHAGAVIDLRQRKHKSRSFEDLTISPNILYQQQLHFNQLNYGFYVNWSPFVSGIWYRQNFQNSDAIIFLAGIQQNTFKIGYSYDLTVSKLTNITGGAHEISVALMLPCPAKKKKIRTINCPSF
ncbi:MAG: type IX secretion system membrane protein PorP/SprF [Bacteroidetes bacterium]|nr:type IX secretion system membrane protein PorP/SprF [Bacteroidota bacterium]